MTVHKLGLLVLSLLMLDCSNPPRSTKPIVRIKGSDTMLPLTKLWAEEFMRQRPGVSVYTEGGGTEDGFRALTQGKIDISTASRPMRPEEARGLAERQSSLGYSFLVAKDALSIFVHPENPIRELSLAQLRDIFAGRIVNWKEVRGRDQPIMVFIRPPNSGTYLYFQEHVLEGQAYTSSAQTLPTNQAVVNAIAVHSNAIGYGGFAFEQSVVHCQVEGVRPSEENVRRDVYPIIRYLHLYTRDTPRGYSKQFIDWVLSPTGQQVVRKAGYFPIFP